MTRTRRTAAVLAVLCAVITTISVFNEWSFSSAAWGVNTGMYLVEAMQ